MRGLQANPHIVTRLTSATNLWINASLEQYEPPDSQKPCSYAGALNLIGRCLNDRSGAKYISYRPQEGKSRWRFL